MKFQVIVSKNIIKVMFDSETKINILLYSVTLKLELTIKSNMMIHMRDINDKSLHVIEYISEISVQIKNVIIWQSFFVLKKRVNTCILKRSFEIIMWMIRQMLNNETMRIIIFNSDDDLIQMTFQLYISKNHENMKNWSMIKLSCSLKTLKAESRTYARKLLFCLWEFCKWRIR